VGLPIPQYDNTAIFSCVIEHSIMSRPTENVRRKFYGHCFKPIVRASYCDFCTEALVSLHYSRVSSKTVQKLVIVRVIFRGYLT